MAARKQNASKSPNSRTRKTGSSASQKGRQVESGIRDEIILIAVLAAAIFLFLCNFGIIGPVGNFFSNILFGLFGLPAYILPVVLFVAIAFQLANKDGNLAIQFLAKIKVLAGVVLFFLIGIVLDMISGASLKLESFDMVNLYRTSAEGKCGGGVLFGSIAYLLNKLFDRTGTMLVIIVLAIICIILITERSLLRGVKSGGRRMYENAREENARRREKQEQRREAQRLRFEEEEMAKQQEEQEKILRMDKKVSGVSLDTTLKKETEEVKPVHRDDIHEITLNDDEEQKAENNVERIRIHTGAVNNDIKDDAKDDFDLSDYESAILKQTEAQTKHHVQGDLTMVNFPSDFGMPAEYDHLENARHENVQQENLQQEYEQQDYVQQDKKENDPLERKEKPKQSFSIFAEPGTHRDSSGAVTFTDKTPASDTALQSNNTSSKTPMDRSDKQEKAANGSTEQVKSAPTGRRPEKPKKYMYPPISLLQKGTKKGNGDSGKELRETAIHLEQTLKTFGVKVTVTDISQGPAVTRYELQPEVGVKVSKIVGLADDIKLNLAATDIRIEAPIPGKAAVGIEVPNKENSMVALRDLLEGSEFSTFQSKLAFAVGKDIGGKTVVTDIAKMPHMLIAGSTGSGKSVCINTLIMSILYKASPEEVKLIMVDPKVVELSVYNGIPHLLIPVVTDPKKASAALQWGVAEMTDRYKKFADFNVRDLKGYNKKVESMAGQPDAPSILPQIVIIVDELADLMMVCPGEVEESICRLAQLARAAGIHLIIATQRPSVDVITGLIKANMPSRVAFAVSSGVDSRTILDMNGAEKLLGKGDMLFYPQGYPKPARIQGAFVSDKEVGDVVEFLKNQALGNVYSDDIEEQIKNMGTSSGGGASDGAGGSEKDSYFVDAGRFIIEKDKASIGLIQRAFKVGFNRAARIMDQLYEAGVVGEEEGTKPRKILMSLEQFEQYIEEYL